MGNYGRDKVLDQPRGLVPPEGYAHNGKGPTPTRIALVKWGGGWTSSNYQGKFWCPPPPHCSQQICQALQGGQLEAPDLVGARMVESFHIEDEECFSLALPLYKDGSIRCLACALHQTLTLQGSEQGKRFRAVRVWLGRRVAASPVKVRGRPLLPQGLVAPARIPPAPAPLLPTLRSPYGSHPTPVSWHLLVGLALPIHAGPRAGVASLLSWPLAVAVCPRSRAVPFATRVAVGP